MMLQPTLSLQEKLHILADAAKYDVACTSSGSDRRGKKGYLGNACAAGICHSFASDGRCISLLKILLSNHCIYDCKYCVNRCSNDIKRATFTPEEVCELTMGFYKRNYIEGLFLSSGVLQSPTYTMEQLYRTLFLLRNTYRFNGYIHVKAIPGAPNELLEQIGYLADRMSINMELPTEESLKKLAPHKSQKAIFRPMQYLSDGITDYRLAIGKSAKMERSSNTRYLSGSIFHQQTLEEHRERQVPGISHKDGRRSFVPAGQSTQIIIGATPETDYQLLHATQALYQSYDLKRVFYSAYVSLNADSALPAPDTPAPLLREHRLYQADWLLRFYGFQAQDLLSPQRPDFNPQLDPKCDWALHHLERFPVEINSADYEVLLQVPGIGPKSAYRIVQARRMGSLDFSSLKKIGVVLKRARYFITCSGKVQMQFPLEEQFITRQLTSVEAKDNWNTAHPGQYQQLSLFDDCGLQIPPEILSERTLV